MTAAKLSWLDALFASEVTTALTNDGTGRLDNITSTRATDRTVARRDIEAVSTIVFTGVAPDVTGIADGVLFDMPRRIHLVAAGGPLVLEDESPFSDVENRIVTGTGGNVEIAEGSAAWLVYASSRWRLSGGSGGGGGEANTASNVGGEAEVFKEKSGVDLVFRTLKEGTNITITQNANDVTIAAAAGSGEANTASNVGGGSGVFKQKTGVDLEFKSIVAGTNVTVTGNTNDVTIASRTWSTYDTYANRPAAGTAGNQFTASDGVPAKWVDSGSAWRPVIGPCLGTQPPAIANFSQYLAGGRSTTISDSTGSILMSFSNPNNSEDVRCMTKAAPVSGSYTVTVHVRPTVLSALVSGFGLVWRASSSGNINAFGIIMNTSTITVPEFCARYSTASGTGGSPTYTFSGSNRITLAASLGACFGDGIWLQMTDDRSATRTWRFSMDGKHFLDIGSQSRTQDFTPDEIGLWVGNITSTSGAVAALFDSWEVT